MVWGFRSRVPELIRRADVRNRQLGSVTFPPLESSFFSSFLALARPLRDSFILLELKRYGDAGARVCTRTCEDQQLVLDNLRLKSHALDLRLFPRSFALAFGALSVAHGPLLVC